MPQLIELPTFGNEHGRLTVFEKWLPHDIKRIFFVYGVAPHEQRAKHGHHKTYNALICVVGSCQIHVSDGKTERDFLLDSPQKCLILHPGDWHIMDNFSSDAVLMVASSEYYDKNDYFYEKP